jgi:membrane-bound ClpP family serine protease
MEAPKNKSSPYASTLRWIARAWGTLIALIALFGILENITEGRTIPEHLTGAAFLLVFVGCVVGWFKDLAASLFILGGILLALVTALAFPGSLRWGGMYFLVIPALPGLLFLYVHLAGKKKK